MKNHKHIIVYFFALLLLTSGCISAGTTLPPTPNPYAPDFSVMPETGEIPDFLMKACPRPGSETKVDDYVEVELTPGNFESTKPDDGPIYERVYLVLDGKETAKDVFSYSEALRGGTVTEFDENGAAVREYEHNWSLFALRWRPILTVGEHHAIVYIVTNKGKTLAYTWEFTLIP